MKKNELEIVNSYREAVQEIRLAQKQIDRLNNNNLPVPAFLESQRSKAVESLEHITKDTIKLIDPLKAVITFYHAAIDLKDDSADLILRYRFTWNDGIAIINEIRDYIASLSDHKGAEVSPSRL